MIEQSTLRLPIYSSSSLPSEQQQEDMHSSHHAQLLLSIEQTIGLHRDAIGIEPSWVIKGQICCPRELPMNEGSIWWDAEVRYAVLKVRCDLSEPLREQELLADDSMMMRIVIHELHELLDWEPGQIFLSLLTLIPGSGMSGVRLKDYMENQYRAARNRHIEGLTTRYLGHMRPGHLVMDTPSVESTLYSPAYVLPPSARATYADLPASLLSSSPPEPTEKKRQFLTPFGAL